jgi:hypothetical protein
MSFIESCQYGFLICIRTLSRDTNAMGLNLTGVNSWSELISKPLKSWNVVFNLRDISRFQRGNNNDHGRQLSIKDMMYEHVEKYYIKERNRICHIFRKVIVIALFITIFMVPMTISLKEGSYWTKCSYWLNWSHHFEILRNICVTNDHVYVPLVIITFTSFPHSWLITGFIARVIRRVPIMEHWLPTILALSWSISLINHK